MKITRLNPILLICIACAYAMQAQTLLLRAETIRRDHELTLAIIYALQLTNAQADDIFKAAQARTLQ